MKLFFVSRFPFVSFPLLASTVAKKIDMKLRNARLTVQGSALTDTEEVFFKQAWVKKKNKARVLQLRGNTLLWFEKMTGADDPSNSKNR